MPFNPSFGREFSDLLDRHGLTGEEKPYMYLEGAISKSTIRNWRKGAPAPNVEESQKVREVLSKFPPDEVEQVIGSLAERRAA